MGKKKKEKDPICLNEKFSVHHYDGGCSKK